MTNPLETFKERITSPVFGPFIYFWSILNWQVFVMLTTGETSSAERIRDIKAYLDAESNHWLLPLALTVFYATIGRLLIHLYMAIPRWLEVRKNAADVLAQEMYKQLSIHRASLETTLAQLFNTLNNLEQLATKSRGHLANNQAQDAKVNLEKMIAQIQTDKVPLKKYRTLVGSGFADNLRELRKGEVLMTFLGIKNPKPDLKTMDADSVI